MAGYKQIGPGDGIATRFTSENQPDGRGRKVGLKKSLQKMMEAEGRFIIPMSQVDEIFYAKDGVPGFVAIKVPTKELIVMNLVRIAMSGNASEATRAIELIMRNLDGTPTPHQEERLADNSEGEDLPDFTDIEVLEEVKRLRKSAAINDLDEVQKGTDDSTSA